MKAPALQIVKISQVELEYCDGYSTGYIHHVWQNPLAMPSSLGRGQIQKKLPIEVWLL